MYSPNTLFTKKQATAVINRMLDDARQTGDNKDMSMREVYEAMQNSRYTVEDWDDREPDVVERYCDDYDIPCISYKDIKTAFALWVARVDGRPISRIDEGD